MPYDSVSDLPSAVKKLSSKKQRQWMHVFNSCYSEHGSDQKCFRMAWGVVGKSADSEKAASICDLINFSERILKQIQPEKRKEPVVLPSGKINIESPVGARAMALSLTKLFGGWNGGCRIVPSANRDDACHVIVFSKTPGEFGKRLLRLKQHLTSNGYKEDGDGVYRRRNNHVYFGRSYARRRGKRPLAFMITVFDQTNLAR